MQKKTLLFTTFVVAYTGKLISVCSGASAGTKIIRVVVAQLSNTCTNAAKERNS